MPATTVLLVSLIGLAFAIFVAALAYGERTTRNARS